MTEKLYNKESLKALLSDAIDLLLDNYIENRVSSEIKEDNMASKHRDYYTLTKPDGSKETFRLYGESREDTDQKFQKLCQEFASDNSKWKSSMTFREFVENEYAPNYMVPPFVAETTATKYAYNLRRYIFPEFGDKELSNITVTDIQRFRKKMAEASSHGFAKNLTEKSIEDMTGFLNKIFKIAVALNVIPENPVKRPLLKKVGEKSGHHKPIDREVIDGCKRMIPTIADEKVRIYSALLFFNGGGMRPEEILGLRWDDIDLETGYADICRAVTYAGTNRHVVIKDTKTKNSVRGVVFPKVLVDILKKKASTGFVIHGRDPNSPIPYSGFQRTYRKMQEILGVKGLLCNYDLRTTFATEMIEDGYSSALTAKAMGHKDSRMVETVYAQSRRAGFEQLRDHIEQKNASYTE